MSNSGTSDSVDGLGGAIFNPNIEAPDGGGVKLNVKFGENKGVVVAGLSPSFAGVKFQLNAPRDGVAFFSSVFPSVFSSFFSSDFQFAETGVKLKLKAGPGAEGVPKLNAAVSGF